MSTAKKPTKTPEEMQAVLQKLIAQGRKEGMIRAADLRSQLEEMDLSPEKIEEIYDSFEALNIQVVSDDLDLDLGDNLDLLDDLGDDIDLGDIDEEDLAKTSGGTDKTVLKASAYVASSAFSGGVITGVLAGGSIAAASAVASGAASAAAV